MIPDFDSHGVLPPIRPGETGASMERAPCSTSLLETCQRFGDTPARREILRGLLELRNTLHEAGITEGFQWLDGSFTEDVESLRERAPEDIDVVTFCALGDSERQTLLMKKFPDLFSPRRAKSRYLVDHYLVQTDLSDEKASERLVKWTAYWYSMWSHQRDTDRWKGFISVPLQSNDDDARDWLDQQVSGDGEAT